MPFLTLPATNRVYESTARSVVRYHGVTQSDVRMAASHLRSFVTALGDDAGNDYWYPIVRRLRRYQFEMCAAPLPFSHPALVEAVQLDDIRFRLLRCPSIFPWHARSADDLVEVFVRLASSHANPILDRVRQVANSYTSADGDRTTGLVVKESRLIGLVEQHLADEPTMPPMKVLSPAELRSGTCYDQLIFVGPTRWFPDYVFMAARADDINVVSYTCIQDKPRETAAFIDAIGGRRRYEGWESAAPPDAIEALDLLPRLSAEDIARVSHDVESYSAFDDVTVRPYLLDGGWVVLLEADDTGSELVIDLEGLQPTVERVAVKHIQPGMFLLLRTDGAGDYVVPVADRLLGERAAELRAFQRHWKGLLREAVQRSGLLRISIALLDHGSIRANEQNVRNWISPRFIRCEDERDFSAIMHFIGLGDRHHDYWQAMGLIRRAHVQAGSEIRRRLLAQVREADLRQLDRLGRLDFELPDVAGGRITAFRVEGILNQTFDVPTSRVAHPFELEGSAWRA